MDALVLCGGTGSRLGLDVEKPLLEIGGVPMVDRVIDALAGSRVEDIYAVGSPAVPDTRAHIERRYGDAPQQDGTGKSGVGMGQELPRVDYLEAPGEGYVADLSAALETVETPVLTVVADLPLLEADALDWVLSAYERGSMTVCVPTARKAALGVTIDGTTTHDGTTVTASGVNVVGDPEPETITMTEDIRFAVNVNRSRDAWVAATCLGAEEAVR